MSLVSLVDTQHFDNAPTTHAAMTVLSLSLIVKSQTLLQITGNSLNYCTKLWFG